MAQAAVEIISLDSNTPIGNREDPQQDDGSLESPGVQLQRELSQAILPAYTQNGCKGRAILIICVLFGTTVVGSFSTGLLTVALPRMATDCSWQIIYCYGVVVAKSSRAMSANSCALQASVCLLACDRLYAHPRRLSRRFSRLSQGTSCWLLASGSLHFVVRPIKNRHSIDLVPGHARTGRFLSLPTAVSINTTSFPAGKIRNIGLAFMGARPIGFLIGLVLVGIFVDTTGWRLGYY